YGPVTITKGISIQGHGFGGIFQGNGTPGAAAITINVTTPDPVSLNGLLIEGGGTGNVGINIASGFSVEILNSVVRHFITGIFDVRRSTSVNLLVEDTILSDNIINGVEFLSDNVTATFNRTTANNNQFGIGIGGNNNVMIANSLISN